MDVQEGVGQVHCILFHLCPLYNDMQKHSMHFFWVVRSSQKREDVKFPGNQSQFTVKCLDGCRCSDSFGGKKQILNKKQESGGVIKFTLFKNKQKTTETNKHTKKNSQHNIDSWGGGRVGIKGWKMWA